MAEMTCNGYNCACVCHGDPENAWFTPGEVSRMLGVGTRTLSRWTSEGKLEAGSTLGGVRRYRASEVYRLWEQMNRAESRVPDIH